MRFRPTLWATLAVVPTLAILIGLGVWQLQRLEWKEGLIALRAERVVSPAIDLVPRTRVDRINDPGGFEMRLPPKTGLATVSKDVDAFEYRPIRLAGTFLHDHSIHLVSRTLNGRVGEHLVTPLELAQGGIVLVDRGWVPPRGETGAPFTDAMPEGRAIVEGYIRKFVQPGSFTPDNEPGTDTWFWLDPAAVSAALGKPVTDAFYVEASPAADAKPPVGSVPEIALRNEHLQYALTWFALAIVLAAIYLVAHIKRRD